MTSRRAARHGGLLAALCAVLCGPPCRAGDPGPTPGELSVYAASPTSSETLSYLRALDAASPNIALSTFGYTAEGRPLPVVFVRDGADGFDDWQDDTRPVVLVVAGIHSGEICGNDAILLLLRDVARGLLPDVVTHLRLVLVPIFNLDGHERRSPYHRFTQHGPAGGMGTRRNAQHLDLNRDFVKLETPECRALVRLASQFRPHVFVDLHTDDGMEHQYDLVLGANVDPTLPPGRDALVRDRMVPAILQAMEAEGFRSHLIAYPLDPLDLSRGLATLGIQTALSTGYFETRQAICILSEAYPYEPYERRVRATRSLLQAILQFTATARIDVVETVDAARATALRWAREPGRHTIALGCVADRGSPRSIAWLGKAFDVLTSEVTNRRYPRYRDECVTYEIPFYDRLAPSATTTIPRGYLIEPAWDDVIGTLRSHCVEVHSLSAPFAAEVEIFRAVAIEFSAQPRQGHHPVTSSEFNVATERRVFPPGTWWVPAEQPAGLTAVHLLEPRSPGALLVWNAFDAAFERGLITEDRALEENARRLLADPSIRAEYEIALRDSSFAADPDARLDFFFRKTPFVEEEEDRYPVYRVLGEAPPALAE